MATAELSSRLTPEEVAHFETFGFIVLRGLFSPEEIEAIGREFNELTEEDRQGQPFKGEKRQQVYGFCERRPLLLQIVDDERIYQPLEQLLGPRFYVLELGRQPFCREQELASRWIAEV